MQVSAAYIGVVLIWSTTPLAIKWSGEGTGFLFGVSARMTLSLVLCLALMAILRRRLPWRPDALMTYGAATLGIFGAMMTVYWGAQFIASGLVSVVFGLSPLLVSVLGALWLDEKNFTILKIGGILVGILGLAVVFESELRLGDDGWKGVLGVIASVSLYSLSMVLVKRIDARLPALTSTTGGLLFSFPLFAVTFWIAGESVPVTVPVRTGLSIAYLAVFGSVLGFILFYYILVRLSSTSVALIALVTPVLAVLLGAALNGEHLQSGVMAGCAMILSGLLLHQLGDNRATLARMRLPDRTARDAPER
ncbi:MAG: DMT family transporter [Gammaproteobacteria bacterium]|jgi:drug/metabolite transporter (DMT)-like permease|nr:DMT family transporter [Gammaproteobacteria bacterium]